MVKVVGFNLCPVLMSNILVRGRTGVWFSILRSSPIHDDGASIGGVVTDRVSSRIMSQPSAVEDVGHGVPYARGGKSVSTILSA